MPFFLPPCSATGNQIRIEQHLLKEPFMGALLAELHGRGSPKGQVVQTAMLHDKINYQYEVLISHVKDLNFADKRTQWIRFFFPFSSSRFESRHTVTLLFTERSIYKLKHELFNNLRITRPKMTSSIKPLTKISGTKNIFIFKGFLSAKLWCTRHGYRCSNSKFLFFIKHQYLISQNRVIR